MSGFDLIIRNGQIVTGDPVPGADVGILEGKIAAIGPNLSGSATEEIDASRLHVFPGLIDSHVHFNEPGRTEWEGVKSGSQALAAGGGTMFFDMPLNSSPPTVDVKAFDQKLAAAAQKSLVDFCLWAGLIPGNLDQLKPLAERGVVGFKAFMANSGIEDFPCVDDRTLREGMKIAADLGRIVAVHAESEAMTSKFTAACSRQGKLGVEDYLASRPIEAELDAIARALELAHATGCQLHIVHVSCGAGVALVTSARDKGVKVTCETCPHYLVLTENDLEKLRALAKCAPPLRPKPAQDALWEYLLRGHINTVASDHSPSPPSMKQHQNFFKIWGGISGIQHTLPLLITEGFRKRSVPLRLLARLFSTNVAARFGLSDTKGEISPGSDADLALVDLDEEFEVKREHLLDRHKQSPYVGRRLTGKVVQTILRGQTIFKHRQITAKPAGRFVSIA